MPRQSGQAERRRHTRVNTRIPFHLVTDGKDEPFDLVDLSESGVRIRSPRALVPMTQIRVRVVLPAKRVGSPADVALDTTGVVVWSHKEAGPGGYDVGVFFSELEDRERNLLRTFVGAHG
jgi:c-di-GMP-binding flagellar brake protein YcgR